MKKKFWVDIVTLLGVFVLTYWSVPFIFFQQDEWRGFGLMITQGVRITTMYFGTVNAHFVPVNLALGYLTFKLFSLSYVAYNLLGLIFHFTNGVLVYTIASKLLQKRVFAILAGVFFITSSVSAQLVMWPAVSISTLSATFTLLAWVIILKEKRKSQLWDGLCVGVLMILALLTVEYSLGMLIFIPGVYLLLTRKASRDEKIIFLLPTILLVTAYFVMRFFLLFLQVMTTAQVAKTNPGFIVDKLFLIPVRYLAQIFAPEGVLVPISHLITKNPIKAETIVFNTLTLGLGMLICAVIILFVYLSRRDRKSNYKQGIIIIILFWLASAAPFILLQGQAGNFFIFPPRYLYFGIVSMALLASIILEIGYLHFNRIFKILLFVGAFLMIVMGVQDNWRKAITLTHVGRIRENVLKTVQKAYPTLPQKAIFYTESDSSYYYQEGKILPFQSGLGYTLLIWYSEHNQFNDDFYEDNFLWDIKSQGYKEKNGRGFGYFRDYSLLKDAVLNYQIPIEGVMAFSWQGKTNSLVDISPQVRKKLKGESR